MGKKRAAHYSVIKKGFGSLKMSEDDLDERAVQRAFMDLKKTLNFESLLDELNQRNLLSEQDCKDYVFNIPGTHFKCAKIIKLMIKRRWCKGFVAYLHETPRHKDIWKKIKEIKDQLSVPTDNGQTEVLSENKSSPRGISNFRVTDELLKKHFDILYTDLEPREIADELFQAGLISVSDHDIVTDSPKKYNRLRSLLKILELKKLHGPFLHTLESFHCDLVLKTLKTDTQFQIISGKFALWIQHSFTILQEELPDADCAAIIMKHVLDFSNISDIYSCNGSFRQKSKLLKIILMKGEPACKKLVDAIRYVLKREDLIQTMESRHNAVLNRGKPDLMRSLTSLTTSCLQEHEVVLYDELEPIVVCDLLFEEEAVNILDHDFITETKQRQKQIQRLIKKLKENNKDCFHYFLYILEKEKFKTIRKLLEKSPSKAVGKEPNPTFMWKLSHSVVKIQENVNNEPIQMRLTVYGQTGKHVEQVLYQRIHSSDTEIIGEALSHGQMDIDDVFEGSVILRLKPITDKAVQTLISAKENNRLLQMIFEILQRINIAKFMSDSKSLKIRIQVFYDKLATSKQETEISKAEFVEKRVKVHRHVLLAELDPMDVIYELSKSKSFPKGVIDSVCKASSCYEKVDIISTFVENGSPEVVDDFRSALEYLDHCDTIELIDSSNIHIKAEEIRKKIISNYAGILNEMQLILAKETLSKCIGDTAMIKEKILPRNGSRRQRMSNFLRFILHDDHNVLEFEKMLIKNGLQELLIRRKSTQEDNFTNEDIDVKVVEDISLKSSEEFLFDSVVTLSYTGPEMMQTANIDDSSTNEDSDDMNTSSDELIYQRNSDDDCSYSSIQEEMIRCFEYIKTFINDDNFIRHVRQNSNNLNDIEEKLDQNILDLKRTDGAIVFAGETSSGKSSIINGILGEKILPTGITATTTRVCRIKYAKELIVSARDQNDKKDIKRISVKSTKQMADEVKNMASTDNSKISFVDIFMPVRFQQGNIAIVDTPGIGDSDQTEVAEKMMNYLPNALAFVFVINVAAAGGLQKDRIIKILEHVKQSLKRMVCFDHEDVIFLLNRWDTFLDDDEKDAYFESIKERLRSIWEEVEETRILKLSMNKNFNEHEDMFQGFQRELEDVIEKNKGKRLVVHLGFLKEFITTCTKIVSPKLQKARENADSSHNSLDKALKEVDDLRKVRLKEKRSIDERIKCFLDVVTTKLYMHIHGPTFKATLMRNVATSWRLKVGFDVDDHIEKETKRWEEMHIEQLYQENVVKKLHEKLQNICGPLAEYLMKGFKVPFDLDNKIAKGVLRSAASIAGGIAIRVLLLEPKIALGVAATGLVFTGLVTFGYINDFETVCENAVDVRIENLTEENIRNHLRARYSGVIRQNMNKALTQMKFKLDDLQQQKQKMENEDTANRSAMNTFITLDEMLSKCKKDVKVIKKKWRKKKLIEH